MIGVTNLTTLLDYGRSCGVLRKTGAFRHKMEKETEKGSSWLTIAIRPWYLFLNMAARFTRSQTRCTEMGNEMDEAGRRISWWRSCDAWPRRPPSHWNIFPTSFTTPTASIHPSMGSRSTRPSRRTGSRRSGTLARYRMALAAHLSPSPTAAAGPESGGHTLASLPAPEPPAARIDASPSPSIGAAALVTFELEPEREQWRNIARNSYGDGLRDQPGNGKLHHHIAMLCREDETLQSLYHYTKRYAVHSFRSRCSGSLHHSLPPRV